MIKPKVSKRKITRKIHIIFESFNLPLSISIKIPKIKGALQTAYNKKNIFLEGFSAKALGTNSNPVRPGIYN